MTFCFSPTSPLRPGLLQPGLRRATLRLMPHWREQPPRCLLVSEWQPGLLAGLREPRQEMPLPWEFEPAPEQRPAALPIRTITNESQVFRPSPGQLQAQPIPAFRRPPEPPPAPWKSF